MATPNRGRQPGVPPSAESPERLLTPSEVAAILRVDAKTVVRYHRAGRLPAVTLPGGHRRFRAADVQAVLDSYLKVPARQRQRPVVMGQVPGQLRLPGADEP